MIVLPLEVMRTHHSLEISTLSVGTKISGFSGEVLPISLMVQVPPVQFVAASVFE